LTDREYYMREAKTCHIELYHEKVYAHSGVPTGDLRAGSSVTFDFGNHYVGSVTLDIRSAGSHQDAPALIRIRYCENRRELEQDPESYEGWISKGWIQEEILHLDVLPGTVCTGRRYAFRFVKVDVIDTSSKFGIVIDDIHADTVTSADDAHLPAFEGTQMEQDLARVSCRTLRNCMQEVFEDGPKRDRRLWLGDFRLQALANSVSYRNDALVRKCLYLFAAVADEKGRIPACLFLRPAIEGDDTYMFDYSLFFISVLKHYVEVTGDKKSGKDLWKRAVQQWELAEDFFENNIVQPGREIGWCFVDWNLDLDKTAAAQGIYLFCCRELLRLGHLLFADDAKAGCTRGEVQAADEDTDAYMQQQEDVMDGRGWAMLRDEVERRLARRREAAADTFYDPFSRLFTSGPGRQISVMSQAWCVLGGVIDPADGAKTLRRILEDGNALQPVTPYAYHTLIDAMLLCGMRREAYQLMISYWGSMIRDGADTFYELFDPSDPDTSPYGSCIINSYCHAWSCTPVYFMEHFRLREGEL